MNSWWNVFIIFSVSIVIIALLVFVKPKGAEKVKSIIIKSLAILFGVVVAARACMSDSFLYVINGGFYEEVFRDKTDVLQSILRWGLFISWTVVLVAVFCKNKTFKNIAILFCLPFTVLSVFFYGQFMSYFMAPGTILWNGFIMPSWIRNTQFSLELILGIVLPLYLLLVEKSYPNFKSKKEMLNLLAALPVVIVTLIPMYVPQSLWGYTSITLTGLSLSSFISILIIVFGCYAVYYVFRFASYETRYAVCLYAALASLYSYMSMYMLGHTVSRIPLQLCDLASYLFLICIIFKKQKLFNFCMLANVLGTLIAMFEPDEASALFSAWSFHFAMEHIWVLAVPIIFLSLRMFPQLNKSALKDCAIYFLVYFCVCAVSGTIINGLYLQTGIKVNYFYLFNDRVLNIFKFMSWTRDVYWKFGTFGIYPVYLLLFYGIYYAGCVGVYYAVQYAYKIAADHFFIRQVRIKEWEEKTGKKSTKIFDYEDADRRNHAENH